MRVRERQGEHCVYYLKIAKREKYSNIQMRIVKLSALANSYLVVVNIQIVWRRKDGDQRGKARYLILAVHAIAVIIKEMSIIKSCISYTCFDIPRVLCLVCAHYRQQIVLLQELTAGRVAEEI